MSRRSTSVRYSRPTATMAALATVLAMVAVAQAGPASRIDAVGSRVLIGESPRAVRAMAAAIAVAVREYAGADRLAVGDLECRGTDESATPFRRARLRPAAPAPRLIERRLLAGRLIDLPPPIG